MIEIFFSGQLDKERTLTNFTHINFSSNNVIFNIFDSFKQKMFLDRNRKIYEWSKAQISPESNNLKIDLKEWDSINDSFKDISKENPKNEIIIDIKNTKSQILFLTDQHKLALMQIVQVKQENNSLEKIHFSFISRDFFPGQKIIKMSCGSSHTIALTDKGTVYSWGSNSNGRLGQGKKENILEPTLMYHLLSYNIIEISAGLAHNIALGIDKKTIISYDQEGFNMITSRVLAWGSGNSGCLGNSGNEDQYIPTKIDYFDDKNVKEACAGYTHSCVLTYDGKLYTFGNNEYGQLGVDNEEGGLEPKLINLEDKTIENQHIIKDYDVSLYKRQEILLKYVVKMFVGPLHMMAISNDGNIYSWGLGSYGQLGTGETSYKQSTPKRISLKIIENMKNDSDMLNLALHPNNINKLEGFIKMVLSFDATFIFINIPENFKLTNCMENNENNTFEMKNSRINDISSKIENINPDTSFTMTQGANNTSSFYSKTEKNESFSYEFNTVFASRPQNLPPKNKEEEENHKKLIENQKKTFLKKLREEENKKQKSKEKKEKYESKRVKAKKEWIEDILPKWQEKRTSDHVKILAYFGIPTSLRSQIWTKQIKNRLSITREYYEVFLAKGRYLSTKYQDFKKLMKESKDNSLTFASMNHDDPLITKLSKESTIKMIEVDLPRTFPTLAIFCNESPVYNNLKDLLQAFACSRPDIGYIQGMSYIAGLLLLYLDTYDAFVCFSNLVTQHFLLDFFLLEEKPIMARLEIFKFVFKLSLPDLYNHFEKESLSPKMFVFEWFLTLYSKALNLDFVSRIWDILFLEGPIILYKTAIAILKQIEEILLEKDLLALMKVIKNLGEYIKDEDELVKTIKTVTIPLYIAQEIERSLQ